MKIAMECNEKGLQQRVEPSESMIVRIAVCWWDLGYLQYTRIELLDPWCPSCRPHNDRADIVTCQVLFRVDAYINLK
jgi:hypothetical protein